VLRVDARPEGQARYASRCGIARLALGTSRRITLRLVLENVPRLRRSKKIVLTGP